MSLAASGASLRRSGCHFRRSERYAVRILSSVAPSWSPRISYADCPSVVAEFLTRNAMLCERGESARVEEEEQRMRGSNILLVVPAAAAQGAMVMKHTGGPIFSSLKERETSRADGIGSIKSVSSTKTYGQGNANWFTYNSSSGMMRE
eukprot:scaffold3808_cov222-Pinguiococcus_pyrenoidosus.AAC.13